MIVTRLCLMSLVFALGAGCSQPPDATPAPDPGLSPSLAWESEGAGKPPIPLRVVDIDTEQYSETGTLRIDVESWDRTTESAVPLDPDGLALILDGVWVPGTFTIEPFSERGAGLALGVVVAGDAHFNDATWSAIDEGLASLAETLGARDTAWVWNDGAELRAVLAPSAGSELARVKLAGLPREPSADPAKAVYRALEHVAEHHQTLPRRRHLVVVTDGAHLDERDRNEPRRLDERMRKRTDANAELAATTRTTLELIGIEVDPIALAPFELMAHQSIGSARKVPVAEVATRLAATLATLGRELAARQVVTFRPRSVLSVGKRADIVFAARSADGRFGRFVLLSARGMEF